MRTWKEVYQQEQKQIRRRREVAFLGEPGRPDRDDAEAANSNGHAAAANSDGEDKPLEDLVGLALSGGGIRSALFNDGFLQALSHKGMLRYIDYISSISGGGYIAGHLIASGVRCRETARSQTALQAESQEETSANAQGECPQPGHQEASFHERPAYWRLGKHPESGRQDSARLSGVGHYLAKPSHFATAFMASQIFTFATYVGATGILATLVALLWRSFDHTGFRQAKTALGFDIGGELLVAFLPVLLLVPIWIGLILLSGVVSLFRRSSGLCNACIRCVSLCLAAGVLCSAAIFLGNSTTEIASGEAFSHIHLNKTATWLAIAAGATQILAFLGRDRLFRSEAVEATHFQRIAQRVLSALVLGIALFAMVHLMGRENISGYTHHRDMQLVRAEIDDWPLLFDITENYLDDHEPQNGQLDALCRGARSEYENLENARHEHVRPVSDWVSWQEEIYESRPWPTAYADVNNEQTISEMSLLWRFGYLYRAACLQAVLGGIESGDKPRAWKIDEKLRQFRGAQIDSMKSQACLLGAFNDELASRAFTDYLIGETALPPACALTPEKLDDWIDGVSESRIGWGPQRKEALAEGLLRHAKLARSKQSASVSADSVSENSVSENSDSAGSVSADVDSGAVRQWEQRWRVRTNRELLDLAYPDLIRARTIASTAVVVAHDQATRRRWLLVWLATLAVGLVGTTRLNRQSPLYQYYRNVLGRRFLEGWPGGAATQAGTTDDSAAGAESGAAHGSAHKGLAEMSLTDADVTDVGLPYPLLLATLFRRTNVEGNAKLERRPFLFTPKYVGVSSSVTERVCVETENFGIPQRRPWPEPVSLADAIAISGSAITPSMTENRALAMIMDFFGLRLGQWIPNPTAPKKLFWGYMTIAAELVRSRRGRPWAYAFAADGGFFDYLGVYELLQRRCRLIVVTDAGSNINNEEHGPLAEMLERASSDLGVAFLDLDHEAPIDLGRLTRDDQRLVPQPYLCMRIRYHDESGEKESEGIMLYVQMAITESDPIEIRQIRHRFPSFPDEPTENQFYTDDQVAAFRRLGYHIGSRVCRDLERWTRDEVALADSKSTLRQAGPTNRPFYGDAKTQRLTAQQPLRPTLGEGRQPIFQVVRQRLLSSYRSNCFEEVTYRVDDIFAEAVWDPEEWCFPTVARRAAAIFAETTDRSRRDAADRWLTEYEASGDVRAAYRHAIFLDVNHEILPRNWRSRTAHWELLKLLRDGSADEQSAVTAHFVVTAIACHQLHRGTPRSALQIGGRQKLIDIMCRIASDLAFDSKEPGTSLLDWMQDACAELVEMRRRVFHGAELQTVVSVMQTFLMQGFFLRDLLKASPAVPDLSQFPSIRFRRRAFKLLKHDDLEGLKDLIAKTIKETTEVQPGAKAGLAYASAVTVGGDTDPPPRRPK